MTNLYALQTQLAQVDASIESERRIVEAVRLLLVRGRPIALALPPAGSGVPDDALAQRMVLRAHQGALSRLLAQRDRIAASIYAMKGVR